MPILLKDRDISSDLADVDSALVVPCRFCPAANLAVREGKPYIELLRTFLRTDAYESYVRALLSRLRSDGVKADVFDSKAPYNFIMCMWTAGRRTALGKRATDYDAAIVLGCDAAVETARLALRSTDCRVIPGMEIEGIMNVIPTVRSPLRISLEVGSRTPLEVTGGAPASAHVD